MRRDKRFDGFVRTLSFETELHVRIKQGPQNEIHKYAEAVELARVRQKADYAIDKTEATELARVRQEAQDEINDIRERMQQQRDKLQVVHEGVRLFNSRMQQREKL